MYDNAEQISAFGSCFLMASTIDWANHLARFFFSLGASLISAFVVNRIKEYREKKKSCHKEKK
jgi:hypothetical protein